MKRFSMSEPYRVSDDPWLVWKILVTIYTFVNPDIPFEIYLFNDQDNYSYLYTDAPTFCILIISIIFSYRFSIIPSILSINQRNHLKKKYKKIKNME